MALGVPHTSDPRQMLVYAYQMMDQGRPIPAKNFIDSAIEKYQAQNDVMGLAEAYHTYGNLYKYGNFDKTIYMDNFTDYDISLKYFTMAADLYASIDNNDGLTRSYFGIGNIYSIKGDSLQACLAYDKSNMYYDKMIKLNPNVTFRISSQFKDYPDMILRFKKKDNCK
jgi:tetratricopeptide (TPR) repeat protein